jgi:hypothetical protein
LVVYRDWRHVADLIRDDDTRAVSQAAVVSDAVVARAMSAASGLVETACFRGGRYTTEDLQAIVAGNVCKEFLIQLVCDLAFWTLLKRRKPDMRPENVAGVTDALETLQRLKLGEAIFPFLESADAGDMDFTMLDPFASKSVFQAVPLDQFAYRMFGQRMRTLRSGGYI